MKQTKKSLQAENECLRRLLRQVVTSPVHFTGIRTEPFDATNPTSERGVYHYSALRIRKTLLDSIKRVLDNG